MGQKQENPLPEEDNDTKLTEQFGILPKQNYQHQETIHNIPPYKTQQHTVPRLDKFS